MIVLRSFTVREERVACFWEEVERGVEEEVLMFIQIYI